MTSATITAAATEQRAPHTRRTARAAVAVGAVLMAELALAGPTLLTGIRSMAQSSMWWLLVAAAVTFGSTVAFGAVRLVTLRAGGVDVSLSATVAMSYAAGAVHASVPAGGVFSSFYAFRRIRAWGASTALATWSMAITGLLATATLTAVGLTGLVLAGGSRGSAAESAVEMVVVVVVVGLLTRITRRPEILLTIAEMGLRLTNRLRGRPAESGFAAVAALVADLQSVRPAWRHWACAVTLSLLNWVLDLACLAACCAAFGIQLTPASLLLTYSVGMAASSLSPLPAGLGVTEGAWTLGLTAAGAPAAAALAAVIVYRLLSTGSVVLVGWIILLAHRTRGRVRSIDLQPDSAALGTLIESDQNLMMDVATLPAISSHPAGANKFAGRTTRRAGHPRFVLATNAKGSP